MQDQSKCNFTFETSSKHHLQGRTARTTPSCIELIQAHPPIHFNTFLGAPLIYYSIHQGLQNQFGPVHTGRYTRAFSKSTQGMYFGERQAKGMHYRLYVAQQLSSFDRNAILAQCYLLFSVSRHPPLPLVAFCVGGSSTAPMQRLRP